MFMGVSSTATKGPFCSWPPSLSSSSRFLSSAPLKRREMHSFQNTHGTNLNITMLSHFPRLYHSSYHSAKMTSRYRDQNSVNLPNFVLERQESSRNHIGPTVSEAGHNNPSRHTNLQAVAQYPILSTAESWERETMNMKRRKILALFKNEGLQDGSSYSLTEEKMDYKQRLLQDSKPLGAFSLVPAETEKNFPKDSSTGYEALDYVNGDSKKQFPSPKHFDKEPKAKSSGKIPDHGTNKNPKVETTKKEQVEAEPQKRIRKRLGSIYSKVRVVNNVSAAKEVVRMLTGQYRHLVHACDTEVAKIDVKQETPIDHGEVICFSIYSGQGTDFGNGKSCIWVDVLDGGGSGLLKEFAPFFEDPSILKVWHNYSFDNHVLENYGLKLSGFHADTMHMARLWDSSRRTDGGYSLEALTGDQRVMSGAELQCEEDLIGKTSMKTIFARKKVKKDGSEGKTMMIPPLEELQREERKLWICYSALDAISTLKLYESLRKKLMEKTWKPDEKLQSLVKSLKLDKKPHKRESLDFYEEFWQPFGEVLVKMETVGMLVDRAYLAEIEKVAKAEQEVAANTFRNWASKFCPDAKYMNVGSDTQLRQLLFGGTVDSEAGAERSFKVLNTEGMIEEGKKNPTKYRTIKLHRVNIEFPTEMYTASGLPSVSGDALKSLAAKISAQYDFTDETPDLLVEDDPGNAEETYVEESDSSMTFRTLQERREAFHAINSLCKGSNVSGKNGRVHCSLNINTETGRLSARRPNLQNQPALEKDRYKIRQAFIAAPGNSLIVADYGQLELRILAHLADCKSMLDAFKAGGDFHSRTAMNMYPHIREAVEKQQVLLEWHPQPGETKPPVPLLKDAFGSERRKAKMLNFSIAYGKTPLGLARDWKVSVEEAKKTVDLWYNDRKEVLTWQEARKKEARELSEVYTLLGRSRRLPSFKSVTRAHRNHIERAAINTPVQGSAADVAMCAMLEISKNPHLKELGWTLLLQVHDEVILEGPSESAEAAKAVVVECMSKPFNGENFLSVDLNVDAKCAQNWYAAK